MLIEKLQIKYVFGEFLEKELLNKSSYLIYISAFLILFSFGIGLGFIRYANKGKLKLKKLVINL